MILAEPSTWIKVNRNIIDWHWFKKSPITIQLFLYLIIKANFGDTEINHMMIKRGQYFATIGDIADDLNLTRQNVKTALNHLRNTGEIETQNISNKLLITICNYNKYQGGQVEKQKERGTKQNTRTDSRQKRKQEKQEYVPQYWEAGIPRHYWGKFQTEDDYYHYAESNREEVEKWLMN